MKTIPAVSVGTSLALVASLALAAPPMESTNYRIGWDVTDGGGGTMTSPSYVVNDSLGQNAIGQAASTNHILQGGFHSAPDSDADLIRDFMDNCSLDPNADQFDSNADGFGNICDADVDNDGQVGFDDLNLLKLAFFTDVHSPEWNPDLDFNNDGEVGFADLNMMKLVFFGAPGPSGRVQ